MIVPKITANMEFCAICGASADWHHVIHGHGKRELASEDGLVLPLCPYHHQYSDVAAHMNNTVDTLCEIIGQLAFERNQLAEGKARTIEDAEAQFLARYEKKYL